MKVRALEEGTQASTAAATTAIPSPDSTDGGKTKATSADDAIKILLAKSDGSPLAGNKHLASSAQDKSGRTGPGYYRMRSSHNLPHGMSNTQQALDKEDKKRNDLSPGADDKRSTRRSRTPEAKVADDTDKPATRPKPKEPTTAPPSASEDLRASKIIVTAQQNGSINSSGSEHGEVEPETTKDAVRDQAPSVDKSLLSKIEIVSSSSAIPREASPRKEITPPPAATSSYTSTKTTSPEVRATSPVKISTKENTVVTPNKPPRTLPPLSKTPNVSQKPPSSPTSPPDEPPPPPLTSPPPLTPKDKAASPSRDEREDTTVSIIKTEVSNLKTGTQNQTTTEVKVMQTKQGQEDTDSEEEKKEVSTFSLKMSAASGTTEPTTPKAVPVAEQNGGVTSDVESDYSTPPTERKRLTPEGEASEENLEEKSPEDDITTFVNITPSSSETQKSSEVSSKSDKTENEALSDRASSEREESKTLSPQSQDADKSSPEPTIEKKTESFTPPVTIPKERSTKPEINVADLLKQRVRPKEPSLNLNTTETFRQISHSSGTPDSSSYIDSGFIDDSKTFSYVTNDSDMDEIFGPASSSSPESHQMYEPSPWGSHLDYEPSPMEYHQEDEYPILGSPRAKQPPIIPEPDPRISQLLGTTNSATYSTEHIRAKLRENQAHSQAPISSELIRNRLKETREAQGIGHIPRAGTSSVSVDDTYRRLEMVKSLRRRLSSSGPHDEATPTTPNDEDEKMAERYAKVQEKVQQEIERAKQRQIQQELLQLERGTSSHSPRGRAHSHGADTLSGTASPRSADGDDVLGEHYYEGSRNAEIKHAAEELDYFKYKRTRADSMCNAKIDRLLSGIGQRYQDHQHGVISSLLSSSSRNLHQILNAPERPSRTTDRDTNRYRRTQSSDRYRYRGEEKPKFYAKNPFDTVDV